jgi:regulator of PEP synthase PpsR (kinase-PPPase family)
MIQGDLHIYLVSDTINMLPLEIFARNAMAHFPGKGDLQHNFPNVKHAEKASEVVIKAGQQESSIILFQTTLNEVRNTLLIESLEAGITCIDVFAPALKAFSDVLQSTPIFRPEEVWELNESYFQRVSAIEFAINNDDGKSLHALQQADLILIGVSRTSKTPLSIYLAYHNYKVINIPLVPHQGAPENLFKISGRKVIGLTIGARRLQEIRSERNSTMGVYLDTDYSDMGLILEELDFADSIMKRIGCPVIDVTNQAVEETAEQIMKMRSLK